LQINRERHEPASLTIVGEQRRDSGFIAAWMIQSKSRSTGVIAQGPPARKAKQLRYAAPREMCRLLRVAEEYDKLADRHAEWQGSAQLPAAEPPEP
jgi:hypothetical protein